MLEDYRESQKKAYDILMNEINSNQLSHAYLFDENGYGDSFKFIISFVKEVLCKNVTDYNECQSICKRIDDGNYPELKIIIPDGMLIKKQQIIDLQHDFSMTAAEGNKRIYIIRDCEKMRPETANSMLKFLEEPENNLIAILITNNYNNLLSTIISRCQIIRFGNDSVSSNSNKLDDVVLEFIKKVESSGINVLMDEKEILLDKINIKDREMVISFFDEMIDMYYDIMKINISENNSYNIKYYDELLGFSKKNDNYNILRKINKIIELKERIKYNVNCNLLIDDLIINIGG